MHEQEDLKTYFISHAPDQRVLANAVENLLKRREDAVSIMYEWDFSNEEDFVREISDVLVDADVVICLVSPDFMSSLWCVKEFVAAQKAQKLIPIFTEECDTQKLPNTTGFISLVGLGQDEQFAKLESELNALVGNLNPEAMDYGRTFEFVEQVPLILPLFGGAEGHDAEIFQEHAAQFLDNIMSKHNVRIIAIPQVVGTKEEAKKILDSTFTDIVLCGKFTEDQYIDVGFVTTRGWKLVDGEVAPELEFDLKFRPRTEVFDDLAVVLKFAFGNLEKSRNRFEKAEQCFTEGIEGVDLEHAYNFGMQYMYNYLGLMYEREGLSQEAIAFYTKAVSLDSSYAPAYKNRGDVYLFMSRKKDIVDGRYDFSNTIPNLVSAIEDYNQAIKLDSSSTAYHNRAVAYIDLYQFPGSDVVVDWSKPIEDLTHVIELNPELSGDSLLVRGMLYMKLAKYEDALADLVEYNNLSVEEDSTVMKVIAYLRTKLGIG